MSRWLQNLIFKTLAELVVICGSLSIPLSVGAYAYGTFPSKEDVQDLPPAIPCHLLKGTKPTRSFPRTVVAYPGGGCWIGRCPAAKYPTLRFRPLERQNYTPGRKAYLLPLTVAIGDGEGDIASEEFKGWVAYRAEKKVEDYDPAVHDSTPMRRVEKEIVYYPGGYASPGGSTTVYRDIGSNNVPINAPVMIKSGSSRKIMYEMCYLSERVYPTSIPLGTQEDRDAFTPNGSDTVYYSAGDPPTLYGHLMTSAEDFADYDRSLTLAITGITLIRDMTPILGTACSAVACIDDPSWVCWGEVGLDAASDAATLIGVGIAAKAAKLTQVGKVDDVAKLAKAERALRNVNYAVAAGNAGIAMEWYRRGELGRAVGRGIAAGADIGIIELATQGIRVVRTRVKTKGNFCKNCPRGNADIADNLAGDAIVYALPPTPSKIDVVDDEMVSRRIAAAVAADTANAGLNAAQRQALEKVVDGISESYSKAMAASIDPADFVDEIDDLLKKTLAQTNGRDTYVNASEYVFPWAEQERIINLCSGDPKCINAELLPTMRAMDLRYTATGQTLVVKHLRFETKTGEVVGLVQCCDDGGSALVSEMLSANTKVAMLEEALHAAQFFGRTSGTFKFTDDFDEVLMFLQDESGRDGLRLFFIDALQTNAARDAANGTVAQAFELEPAIMLKKYFDLEPSVEAGQIVADYSGRYASRYYYAVMHWMEGKPYAGKSGNALRDWLLELGESSSNIAPHMGDTNLIRAVFAAADGIGEADPTAIARLASATKASGLDVNRLAQGANTHGFDMKNFPGDGGPGDIVLAETLANRGNITSTQTLDASYALDLGQAWLGPGYREIGQPNSGVFRSADGLRQFRMDGGSLDGAHPPGVPHIHFETYDQGASRFTTNNHVPYTN